LELELLAGEVLGYFMPLFQQEPRTLNLSCLGVFLRNQALDFPSHPAIISGYFMPPCKNQVSYCIFASRAFSFMPC